ncbi:TRAF3-interacting protein 1 isoform X2 [Hyla sarda]|uniref:TRAF3-interacting protein 1 isoform X2 n=1 Tax=Hyla sarda TaxID=327740 RepID=UPI0024C3BF6A|nr:TRAF3-interacting protein 1 isoform X2 [Hyla sarda]
MDPAVVRRTQESLGKVIRKPPLTDKLLGRPPFRYLHDILTEVIRTTGFFKGLYTESELKPDNVKDKDAKINFLQKAVDVVTLVTGEPLSVKPARVVAGHEPEKTNEFLQAIGKCCLNKLSSDDAVKRILSGEKVDLKGGKPPSSSKSQDKENREAKDEERRSHKEREDKRETEIRERSGSQDRKDRQVKEEEKKERERRKERERNGETERDGLREGEKNEKEKNKVRESRSETDKERSKEKSEREKGRERERRSEGSHGKEKDRTREKVRERDREQERNTDKEKDSEHRNRDRDGDHGERSRDREQEKSRTRERDKERKRERDPERERRKERGRDNDHQTERDEKPQDQERTENKHKGSEESTRKTSEVSSGKEKLLTNKEKPPVQSKNSRPSASKLRERRPAKPTGEGETASDEEGGVTELHNSESHNVAETNIAAQKKIPRPGSARPAPPRVRRQASAEVVVPERVSSGKGVTNVIVDKQKDDGDDDDNEFVVEEASPQLSEMPKMELEPELDLTRDEKHGSLVKKILETKKDYETQNDGISKDKLLLTDTGRKKEKDLVTKEIEKLRGSIQILCRSALPLGKMMDYIQEDMDTMKNELQIWRTENRQHAEVLLREQSVTDTAVDPLKAELAELEQLIKEQRDKICTVKGNIMRNEEKIQKMVQSIVTSGRD